MAAQRPTFYVQSAIVPLDSVAGSARSIPATCTPSSARFRIASTRGATVMSWSCSSRGRYRRNPHDAPVIRATLALLPVLREPDHHVVVGGELRPLVQAGSQVQTLYRIHQSALACDRRASQTAWP